MPHPNSAVQQIRIWELGTRVFHWMLAATTLAAWILHEGSERIIEIHQWIGYAALAFVFLRLVRGFVGPQNERFRHFLTGPRSTILYANSILQGRESRYLGHNPLGGWMILCLIIWILATGFTGWLSTTDRYWGYEWVMELPRVLCRPAAAADPAARRRSNLHFYSTEREPSGVDDSRQKTVFHAPPPGGCGG